LTGKTFSAPRRLVGTNRTFVVRSASGKHVKFRMLSYYNDQGASGYMKFEHVVE
jgi:hypothetical protein